MKHNNQLPNGHFRKQWQRRVTTWFDQAGQKKARRSARVAKAMKMAPRPVESLRPAVRCPTLKYNMKVRAGRGFTLQELKAAGVSRKYARTVGISVDHRRSNSSTESLEVNSRRLKAYLARLIVFPKKASAPKKGDSSAEACKAAVQAPRDQFAVRNSLVLEAPRAISAAEKSANAYATLRKAWGVARHHGIRAKRAAEKAAAEEDGKKKQ